MGNASSRHGGREGGASGGSTAPPSPPRAAGAGGSGGGGPSSSGPAATATGSTGGPSGGSAAAAAMASADPQTRAALAAVAAQERDPGNKLRAAALYDQAGQVDNGHLVPLSNVYPSSPQDWLHDVVQRLIVERKLAPFYRGLEDYDEPAPDGDGTADGFDRDAVEHALANVGDDAVRAWRRDRYTDAMRSQEVALYKRAAECPICFLYYPPLINTSRCCDQPICTECFVQIKRADPTTTNLVSEPAACPYCMEPNFGVTYVPPPPARRTGLGAPSAATTKSSPQRGRGSGLQRADSAGSSGSELEAGPATAATARRKSVSHTAAEVVTVDSIQADWEAKLAAVRATAARRAARRVVFRQVGDRLVPVGISSGNREIQNSVVDSQGRIILTGPLPPSLPGQQLAGAPVPLAASSAADAAAGSGTPSTSSRLLGRSGRRHRGSSQGQGADLDPRLYGMGIDIEEMMIAEAMRLSMIDEEDRRKKEEKERKAQAKKDKDAAGGSSSLFGVKRRSKDLSTAAASTSQPEASTSTAAGATATASSSGRASTDSPRGSLDSRRNVAFAGPPAAASGTSSGSGASSATRAESRSRLGGSSKNPFLKMPPMQRNDSSASLSNPNLPPPLVPTQASAAPGLSNGAAGKPADVASPQARPPDDGLLL